MSLNKIVAVILSGSISPLTPQEICDEVKSKYPDYYGTASHHKNVASSHYKDIDHALLAQLYTLIKDHHNFYCDRSTKPMRVSIRPIESNATKIQLIPKMQDEPASNYTKIVDYKSKVDEVWAHATEYHEYFYHNKTFGGPSLYFHQRALKTITDPGSEQFLEYVYATLSAWGMHRMGPGGSKMVHFDKFSASVSLLIPQILKARSYSYRAMQEVHWAVLKEIFMKIEVMESKTNLVGKSKVMHHLLPNIIPPIDREYTLQFIFGNKNIKNDKEKEWDRMREIISEFFIRILVDNHDFLAKAENWVKNISEFPWDTSVMKVVDNLIIGAISQRKL